jgi:hypothetical protein
MMILDWFRFSQRVIAICLIFTVLYYEIRYPDKLRVTDFIVWRTTS